MFPGNQRENNCAPKILVGTEIGQVLVTVKKKNNNKKNIFGVTLKGKYIITSLTSTPDFQPPNLLLWWGSIWMEYKFAFSSFFFCVMQI